MSDLIVTSATHPTLFRAFEMISYDCGFGDGYTTYSIPEKWAKACDTAEPVLAKLTPSQLRAFCKAATVKKDRNESVALSIANQLLDAFYKDFEED